MVDFETQRDRISRAVTTHLGSLYRVKVGTAMTDIKGRFTDDLDNMSFSDTSRPFARFVVGEIELIGIDADQVSQVYRRKQVYTVVSREHDLSSGKITFNLRRTA